VPSSSVSRATGWFSTTRTPKRPPGRSAFLVVDQLHETPHWPAAIEHQLLRAEETRPAVAPVDPTDAADAARQVSQLNAMVARGQHRPGVFEEQDKARRAGL
jgi:hypothetical protein